MDEDNHILMENAKCAELVHSDYWQRVKEYFFDHLNSLRTIDGITVKQTDWEAIGKEVVNRQGVISVIEAIFDDIETKAQQHADTQELDDDDKIIHRQTEVT